MAWLRYRWPGGTPGRRIYSQSHEYEVWGYGDSL